MTLTKKNTDKASAKEGLRFLRETMKEASWGQKALFPVVVLLGVGKEFGAIFRGNKAGKRLISAIMDKYDVETVKLDALHTSPTNVYQSQMVVIQAYGKDYAFVLDIDPETLEPTLHQASYISDDMPYQPCPVAPVDFLK